MRSFSIVALLLACLSPSVAAFGQGQPGLVEEKQGIVTNFRVASIEDSAQFKEIRAKPLNDAATLKFLMDGRNALPTPYLFELSRRILAKNPAEAIRWYLIGIGRLRYDAFRCNDRSVYLDGGFRIKWQQMYDEVPAYVRDNPEAVNGVDVKDDPELFSGTASPIYACSHGMGAIIAAGRGEAVDPKTALRPEAQWEPIRAWLSGKGPKPDFL